MENPDWRWPIRSLFLLDFFKSFLKDFPGFSNVFFFVLCVWGVVLFGFRLRNIVSGLKPKKNQGFF